MLTKPDPLTFLSMEKFDVLDIDLLLFAPLAGFGFVHAWFHEQPVCRAIWASPPGAVAVLKFEEGRSAVHLGPAAVFEDHCILKGVQPSILWGEDVEALWGEVGQ